LSSMSHTRGMSQPSDTGRPPGSNPLVANARGQNGTPSSF
jgi:hypothetical protein